MNQRIFSRTLILMMAQFVLIDATETSGFPDTRVMQGFARARSDIGPERNREGLPMPQVAPFDMAYDDSISTASTADQSDFDEDVELIEYNPKISSVGTKYMPWETRRLQKFQMPQRSRKLRIPVTFKGYLNVSYNDIVSSLYGLSTEKGLELPKKRARKMEYKSGNKSPRSRRNTRRLVLERS